MTPSGLTIGMITIRYLFNKTYAYLQPDIKKIKHKNKEKGAEIKNSKKKIRSIEWNKGAEEGIMLA